MIRNLLNPKVWVMMLIIGLCCGNAAKAQNPIATYYQAKGETWPAWTDEINWANVINMGTFSNGANDFQKFENARDQLAAQGGGVLYYPAGTYDFSDHPTGPQGRGLMLRKGVVILGEPPVTDQHAVVDSATPGLANLGTVFQFPFLTKTDVDGNPGLYPDSWNMIGLMPEPGQRVKDVTHIGIAWVKTVGAVVYFGLDQPWAATYGTADGVMKSWLKRGPNHWESRVPDGTHWLDPFMGADRNSFNSPYLRGGQKRFVFGCRLEDAAPGDYMTNALAGYTGGQHIDLDAINPFRYAPRVGLYGAHLLIANNAMPPSSKSFRHVQLARVRNQAPRLDTILFDYGYTIGVDVNKSLASQLINRCNLNTGIYYEPDLVLQDNWVYNHGNKAYEFCAKWGIVRRNINARDNLLENQPFQHLPGGWRIAIDGALRANQIDDNMSRFMDFGGWNLWMDGNWWNNTGSNPGNDGEGMLIQRHGAVETFSFAYPHNRQGLDGELGYIAPWNTHVFGLLHYNNIIRGQTGILGAVRDTIADVSAVFNYNRSTGNPIVASQPNVNQNNVVYDFLADCNLPAPTPPANVQIVPDTSGTAMVISYSDNTPNEFGYRIDRRVQGTNDWTVVAYRPRKESNTVWDYHGNDNGNRNLDCRVGPTELNPTEWYDYLAPRGVQLEYRVTALDCGNSDAGASPATTATGTLVSLAEKLKPMPVLYPNPTKQDLHIGSRNGFDVATVRILNMQGQVLATKSVAGGETVMSLANLPAGPYQVICTSSHGKVMRSTVIKQ